MKPFLMKIDICICIFTIKQIIIMRAIICIIVMFNMNAGNTGTGMGGGMGMNQQGNMGMGMNQQGNMGMGMNQQGNMGMGMNQQGNMGMGMNQQGNMGMGMNQQGNMGMGMNQQNQQSNNVLMRNQQEQIHGSQIKYIMQQIWRNQNQPQINHALLYLGSQLKQINQEMDECTKTQGVSQNDEKFMREVKDRCLKIKRNNQSILGEMLNLKLKMSRMMYITINKDNSLESQYNLLQERIRRKKLEITNKVQELKNRQMIKKTLGISNFNESKESKKHKQAPLRVALTELKDATEIINKQLIQQRQEIKSLIKELYDDNV